uniref:FIIND domain-containing protein n=1 Tax=Hucho hucho TaxID=62062 RepID=A0A4W5L4K9_9TELE
MKDTVDQTVKRYDPEGAVGNTVNILKKMNQHDLTKKLQRDPRGYSSLSVSLELLNCPPTLESPLEMDCPPILERPLEMDCPPILERPLEVDCPPSLESPLEMANSLNTEVAVNTQENTQGNTQGNTQENTQENTQRIDGELGREKGNSYTDSPLLEHHHMSSPDEFTPKIHDQDNRGEYRFQFPCAGLFQCSITGLVFKMEGEGEVLYRTVPWDRRLLAQRGKRPAGPLFNIDCPQKSVCQLHLPHCEILSEGGCDSLSVAHVTDDNTEFIQPHKITETHIIINITGFSAYGDVKDDDAPITSINAHVLLFYLPQPVPRRRATLNVLLLPSNVVISEVCHFIHLLVLLNYFNQLP